MNARTLLMNRSPFPKLGFSLALLVATLVLAAAAQAQERGWAMSEAVARESLDELQRRGIKVARPPAELET